MAIKKEALHDLIDQIPKENYPKLLRVLRELMVPEVEPTEEEKQAIEKGRNQIDKGEYHTLDEFIKELDLEDDET